MSIEITDSAVIEALATALASDPDSPIVVVQKTDTHLSTAQIADAHNTGVICVPAPGVGKMLLPLGMAGKTNAGASAFGEAADLKLVYGTDGDINASPFKAGGDVIIAATDKTW